MYSVFISIERRSHLRVSDTKLIPVLTCVTDPNPNSGNQELWAGWEIVINFSFLLIYVVPYLRETFASKTPGYNRSALGRYRTNVEDCTYIKLFGRSFS